MTAALSKYSPQRRVEAYLRNRYDAFLYKAFRTVSPDAELKWNGHIGLMAEYLEAWWRREITRLVINIPPRTLKSIATTVAWPAFLLGKNPATQMIAASYSERLSTKHSIDTRLIVESEWYSRIFPEVQLLKDQNTKNQRDQHVQTLPKNRCLLFRYAGNPLHIVSTRKFATEPDSVVV
jgi:hypothetical protein